MIQFGQMTQLMNKNVVLEVWWKEKDLVAEIEILERSTTPPTATLVTDGDTIPREIVVLVKVCEARERKRARYLFMFQVVFGDRTRSSSPDSIPSHNH